MHDSAILNVPTHLPSKLAITLWDFSWYTRAGDVASFQDLERCFSEAVNRGYNAVRICAMPFLLFGEHDLVERRSLTISGMGNGFGDGVRWYQGEEPAEFDPLERLGRLFDLADQHDCYVILSSWEYQQSPAFATAPGWHEALDAVPPDLRLITLAQCWNRMLDWLSSSGRLSRVAYVEIHNELEYSKFIAGPIGEPGAADLMRDRVEAAVDTVRQRHPEVLVTMSYAQPQVERLPDLAANLQVAHVHAYVYGVLEELGQRLGLGEGEDRPTPNDALREMSRSGVVPFDSYYPDAPWRLLATVLRRKHAYIFHSVDPVRFDLWLYENYARYQHSMREKLSSWISLTAQWAASLGAPAVLGEGFVGYTPLFGGFEEGPVGKTIAEHAVHEAMKHGFWGTVLCSNCSPVHPFWQDIGWQQRLNADFLQSGKPAEAPALAVQR